MGEPTSPLSAGFKRKTSALAEKLRRRRTMAEKGQTKEEGEVEKEKVEAGKNNMVELEEEVEEPGRRRSAQKQPGSS